MADIQSCQIHRYPADGLNSLPLDKAAEFAAHRPYQPIGISSRNCDRGHIPRGDKIGAIANDFALFHCVTLNDRNLNRNNLLGACKRKPAVQSNTGAGQVEVIFLAQQNTPRGAQAGGNAHWFAGPE